MNSEALATLRTLAKNIDQDPWHWTTAEGIKVTLTYDPKQPNLPVIHTSHLFHVLKIHYNALVKSGVIDADPVNYSVFSRNLDLSYAKEKKEKLAYNIVRMIVELANRDDIQISHKKYFEDIVNNLYDYFMGSKLKRLPPLDKETILKTVPRLGF